MLPLAKKVQNNPEGPSFFCTLQVSLSSYELVFVKLDSLFYLMNFDRARSCHVAKENTANLIGGNKSL